MQEVTTYVYNETVFTNYLNHFEVKTNLNVRRNPHLTQETFTSRMLETYLIEQFALCLLSFVLFKL